MKLLKVEVDSDPNALVKIARSELLQVLMNLISNSADAMLDNNQRDTLIRVSCKVEGQKVFITVEDQGPWVPNDLKDRIFDAFFTTKPAGKGTGLGLSVSKRIIEKANATVQLGKSDTLGGAKFTLQFEKASQEEAA